MAGGAARTTDASPAHADAAPRRGSGALIAVVSVVLAATRLVGGLSALRKTTEADTSQVTRTSRTPDPTSAVTTSEPETSEPETSEPPVPDRTWKALPGPHSTHPSWVALQRNEIYRYDIPPMNCPTVPSSYDSLAQHQSFITNTINCQHNGWKAVFTAASRSLPKPRLYFISSSVISPCGRAGARVSFYCGMSDGSSYAIYMHTNLMEQGNTWWRLRPFETAAHEYGHHVQKMAGILYHSNQIVELGGMSSQEASRREELQTSCWSSRTLLQTKATAFSRRDYNILVDWSTEDQDVWHGSAASNQYWGQRGLSMKTVGGCTTFTVGAQAVS